MVDVKKSVEIAINVTGLKDSQLRSFSKNFVKLQTVVKSVNDTLTTFRNNVKKLKPIFDDFGTTTTKVRKNLKSVSSEFKNAGRNVKSFGDNVRTVSQFRAISAGIKALSGTLQGATKAIVEYDQALKDLQAITGATNFEVAQMGKQILEVANTTKFSASEIAEGMRTIGQAGFSADEAIKTMQAVSDLATGTLSDMSSTVDLVTTAMRVFGIEASRSNEIVDVFANSVNKSKLTVDKLRTAMNYIGPIAKAAGISFKELSTSMSVLANSGLRASTIGTGLRRVFAELVDPSNKLAAAAKNAGVSLGDLDPTSSSLSNVLSNLRLVVSDAQIAFDIFGKRGAAAVLALSNSQSNFDEMLVSLSQSGSAAGMASKQMEGLGVSFKNLKDRMGVLAIALGKLGIADAFRTLIDLAVSLSEKILFLVSNPISAFMIKLVALPVLILAIGKAFKALKAVVIFSKATKTVIGLSTALKTAEASAVGLNMSLGPILLILTGLYLATTTFWDAWLNGATKASNAASELAQEYNSLAEKIKNYQIATINLVEGSTELIGKSISLREELLKVANSTSRLAEDAAKAAASIDPLTGTIKAQSTALQDYQDKLNNISFEELQKAAELANKAIETQTDTVVRHVNMYFDSQMIGLRGLEYKKKLDEEAQATDKLSAALHNNSAKWKDVLKWKEKYGKSAISTQGKALNKDLDLLNEKINAIIESARKTKNISLDDTAEGFKKVGESLQLSGRELDAFVYKMELLAKANTSSFDNIIEKWAKDEDPKFLSNVVDSYNEIAKVQSKVNKQDIIAFEKEKQLFISKLDNLKKEYKANVDKYGKSKELILKYLKDEQKLVQQANTAKDKIFKDSAKSAAQQRIEIYAKELKERQRLLDVNEKTYSGEGQLFVKLKEKEKIITASEKRMKALASQSFVDPKVELEAYQKAVKEKEALQAKYILYIETLERKGVVNSIQSNADKRTATLQHYANLLKLAQDYYKKVSSGDDPKALSKAKKTLLSVEKKYFQEREKFTAFDNKLVQRRKDLANKIIKIEDNLAKKIKKINLNLKEKLAKIEESRLGIKKKVSSSLKDLEESTNDTIRSLKQRNMTDAQKDADNTLAAYAKLEKGRELLAKAEKEGDLDKLKRGEDLVKQSSELYSGLKSQSAAMRGVITASETLNKALKLEGHIKDLDLVAKKNKEITKAEEERIKATKESNIKKKKLQDEFKDAKLNIENLKNVQLEAVTVVFKERTKLEKERHFQEMKNLEDELNKIKEKQNISNSAQKNIKYNTSVSDFDIVLNNEKILHDTKMKDYDIQINKLKEKADTELKAHKQIQTEISTSYVNELQQVKSMTSQGFKIIEDQGIKTMETISDKTANTFEKVYDEHGKLVKILGEGINVEIGDVEVPNIKEDIEKDLTKIDPVEVPITVKVEGSLLNNVLSPDEIQDVNVKVNIENEDQVKELTDVLGEDGIPKTIESSVEISGLQIALNGISSLVDEIAKLKDKTINITENIVRKYKGASVPGHKLGTVLSGYGGGDRRPAMLEDGEGIIRKEAVRMVGIDFINSLNNLRLPKFSLGGIMGGVTNSGLVQSSMNTLQDFGKVTLSTGQMEIPALVHNDVMSELTIKLNNLKRFRT